MEAARLIDSFLYLIIRGIYNYIDLYKSKDWQPYIVVTATIYIKELVLAIPAAKITIISTLNKASREKEG